MSARPTNLRTDILTELTEFGVASPEDQAKSSGFSFTRFFRRNKPADVDSSNELSPRSNSITDNTEPLVEQSYESCETKEKETNGNTINEHLDESMRDSQITYNNRDPAGTRSLTNVLKRISNILDRRSSTPQAYKDSDFKQYWMPDSNCKECYECGDKFNTFRRRHHCRVCGQIFCRRCCNQEIPGKIMGYTENLRACTYCCKVVLSYIQSTDLIPSGDLKAFQDDLDNCLNDMDSSQLESSNSIYESANHNSIHSSGSFRRKVSPGFREEEFVRTSSRTDIRRFPSVPDMQSLSERKLLTKDSSQLQELWAEMENQKMGLEFQSHRHLLQTFENCVVGSEVVNWLLSNDKVSSRQNYLGPGHDYLTILSDQIHPVSPLFPVFKDENEPIHTAKIAKNLLEEHTSEVKCLDWPPQSSDLVFVVYQAVAIGQALIDAGILEAIGCIENVFVDKFVMYKSCKNESNEHKKQVVEYCDACQEPSWVKEIIPNEEISEEDIDNSQEILDLQQTNSFKEENELGSIPRCYSTFYLDLNVKNSTASVKRAAVHQLNVSDISISITPMCCKIVAHLPIASSDCFNSENFQSILPQSDASNTTINDDFLKDALFVNRKGTRTSDVYTAPQGWNNIHNLREENGELLAYERLHGAFEMHRQALIKQLLSNEGISLFWCDTILTVVPGGSKSESQIVGGVVSTKNVLHRKMKTYFENPHILLVSSSIVYQRIENKLSSLEPIIMQECEYLKNVVAKISSYKPDIINGRENHIKMCARYASWPRNHCHCECQTMQRKKYFSCPQYYQSPLHHQSPLYINDSVIERIARCTQADIVSSLDAQLGTPHLGVCHRFWLRNYMMPSGRMKTLMGFDGCPKHLGCTILLRGASHAELSKVKQITQFLVYVNYNWKLECSFLMDEFALPPPLPDAMPLILYDSNQTTQRKGLFKDESMIDMHDEDLFCQKSNFSSEKIIGDELSFENEENIDKKSDEIKGFLKASKEDSTIIPKIETAKLSELHSLEEHIDPLRSECVTDTKPKSRKRSTMVVAPLPLANKFRKALNDVVLSCSPNLKYSVPYLESESGGICELRQFFGEELYWSAQFYKESVLNQNKQQMEPVKAFPHGSTTYINGKVPDNVEIQRYHPFIFTNLTNSVGNPSVSDLLANFRACGGQIKRLCPHEVANKKREKKIKMEESASLKFQSSMSMQNSSLYWERKVDALDTYKHQRLPVLFCSYSYVSNNAPNFCVSPWVVNMDFYGRNDITLGEFLERYCFRSSYECPSETCDTPMTEHIRKFVHENGSIHIVLKKLEKSFQMAESVIVMWSWCFKCKQVKLTINYYY
ncbi:1-phosphatidylinositol 3-phosphate 5-kinase [Nymphon striatum]|nr:1-phosphatidylinositol 3-phosphate 5-kinase [Nymphon striatum]